MNPVTNNINNNSSNENYYDESFNFVTSKNFGTFNIYYNNNNHDSNIASFGNFY